MAHLYFTGYHYDMISIICYLYCQYTNILFYDIINKYNSCNIGTGMYVIVSFYNLSTYELSTQELCGQRKNLRNTKFDILKMN